MVDAISLLVLFVGMLVGWWVHYSDVGWLFCCGIYVSALLMLSGIYVNMHADA